jgi:hypothetical protein
MRLLRRFFRPLISWLLRSGMKNDCGLKSRNISLFKRRSIFRPGYRRPTHGERSH